MKDLGRYVLSELQPFGPFARHFVNYYDYISWFLRHTDVGIPDKAFTGSQVNDYCLIGELPSH